MADFVKGREWVAALLTQNSSSQSREILKRYAAGETMRAIAQSLGITTRTCYNAIGNARARAGQQVRTGSRPANRIPAQIVLDALDVKRAKPKSLELFEMRELIEGDGRIIGEIDEVDTTALVVHPANDVSEIAGYIVFDLKATIRWLWTMPAYRRRGIARWLLHVAVGAQPFYFDRETVTPDGLMFLDKVSDGFNPSSRN